MRGATARESPQGPSQKRWAPWATAAEKSRSRAESPALYRQLHDARNRAATKQTRKWRYAAEMLGGFFLRVSQVLFVGALEVLDLAALKMPDAGGDFVDDVVVVGD